MNVNYSLILYMSSKYNYKNYIKWTKQVCQLKKHLRHLIIYLENTVILIFLNILNNI